MFSNLIAEKFHATEIGGQGITERFYNIIQQYNQSFCQYFMLNASLVDKRTNMNDKEYMLKWGMFTPYKTFDHSSQNMLRHGKNEINFNVSNLMIPGNGYVITLNSAKPEIIKTNESK